MSGKKIIFAVYDDLHHEYRGYKAALTFLKAGWKVEVIGVKFDKEPLSGWEGIQHKRIPIGEDLPFPIKMAVFWFKLTLVLMKEKADLIYSHDLFPLMPAFIASRLKRIPYVYDAHEFWYGNSHLERRPVVKKIWTLYEKIFIKGAKKVITVSDPIARELEKIYGIDEVGVFTNLPLRKERPADEKKLHRQLGLPEETKIVLYQGHFLLNNGLETVIKAFKNVDQQAVLVLIGSGSEKEKLEKCAVVEGIADRVCFTGPFPHSELIGYTVCAHIGLCLIKNSGKSFYYSTPNKMFEFIQAHVPQAASNFPEMARFVKGFGVGKVIDPEDIVQITETINFMLNDDVVYAQMKNNCVKAAAELVWDSYDDTFVKYVE